MTKRNHVLRIINDQNGQFCSSTIQSLSGASPALISNTINMLIEEGKVGTRKSGRRLVYTLLNKQTHEQTTITTEPICTIPEKMDYIRTAVQMVIDNINPSALITGKPGIGKTYIVKEMLEKNGLKEDEDYIFASGHTSAFGLYRLLYDNSESLIVMDDFDSVFKDIKAINILKAALDSYDVRRVSWYSEKTEKSEDIEPTFEFKGKIIFISNLYAEKIDDAVKSRSFCIDLRLDNNETTEYMESILDNLESETSMEIKKEVLEFIDSISNNFESYGIRTLIQSIRIRKGCKGDWKKMIKVFACN